MVSLKLEEKTGDPKIVARSKKSLLREFRITSSKHIDRAVWLALYLHVLGRDQEAKNLLESFVYAIESKEDRRDLWGSNGMGILLLARIYGQEGNTAKRSELADIILSDDILTNRTTRGNLLREEFDYHRERMECYPKETHKYRCEILGERFFKFLYFCELMQSFRHEISDEEASLVSEILDDVYGKLLSEITES